MKKIFTLLLSFAAWLPLGADAADLQVRVFERGGNVPLQGVAVCLGTHARLDQFGAVHTDSEGNALFSELPQSAGSRDRIHAGIQVRAGKYGDFESQSNARIVVIQRRWWCALSYRPAGDRFVIGGAGYQAVRYQ